MGCMAEKRRKTKLIQIRLHPLLRQQLELQVEQNASTITVEMTAALREYLERKGLWPPPKQQGGPGEE